MEFIYKAARLQDYALSVFAENIETVVYSAVCFFAPFLLGHPQQVVGIVVNAMLVTAALNLKGAKLLPVITVPCLGVLSRGLVFGPLTVFLVYFIPFIWIGNAILVFSFKHFRLAKKMNYWAVLAIGTALKSGFLFASAVVLYKLGAVPAVFMASMGSMQVFTAVLGGIAAYGIHYGKKSLEANSS